MLEEIHITDPNWGSLIAQPEEYIYIGPCRIIPGHQDVKYNRKYRGQNCFHEFYLLNNHGQNSFLRRDDHRPCSAAQNFFQACGQEVIVILYVGREKTGFLNTQRRDIAWYLAVIGLNGQIVRWGDDKYPYWEGSKKDVMEKRNKLLNDLIAYTVAGRSEFARFFLPVGGGPSDHGPQ